MQQGRVALVGGVRVARDVGGPFVFGGVSVARADVFVLELFELLLCAEFVCLWGGLAGVGGGRWETGDGEGAYHCGRWIVGLVGC